MMLEKSHSGFSYIASAYILYNRYFAQISQEVTILFSSGNATIFANVLCDIQNLDKG